MTNDGKFGIWFDRSIRVATLVLGILTVVFHGKTSTEIKNVKDILGGATTPTGFEPEQANNLQK